MEEIRVRGEFSRMRISTGSNLEAKTFWLRETYNTKLLPWRCFKAADHGAHSDNNKLF